MVQWLRFHPPNAQGPGLVSGQELRSCTPLNVVKKKKKKYLKK